MLGFVVNRYLTDDRSSRVPELISFKQLMLYVRVRVDPNLKGVIFVPVVSVQSGFKLDSAVT